MVQCPATAVSNSQFLFIEKTDTKRNLKSEISTSDVSFGYYLPKLSRAKNEQSDCENRMKTLTSQQNTYSVFFWSKIFYLTFFRVFLCIETYPSLH